MTRNYFSDCERTIDAEMDEISVHLRFLSAGFKVYSKSGQILGWVNPDPELRPLVQDFAKEHIQDLTVFYQSLFIQVWGRFELFMKTLITAYLEHFSEHKQDFESFEKYGLARRNLKHTGIALQQILENRSDLSVDFYLLAQNASTSVPGSKSVALNSSAFSFFLSGPTPYGIEDAFGRIGINLNWDRLGAWKELQAAFKTSTVRETTKLLEEYLKQAARRRNNIVHRGVHLVLLSQKVAFWELGIVDKFGRFVFRHEELRWITQ